jgi:hypothetical protein
MIRYVQQGSDIVEHVDIESICSDMFKGKLKVNWYLHLLGMCNEINLH